MKNLLFIGAFDKAKEQSGKDTKHGLSTHLEKVFSEDLKHTINRITFVRYYEKYIEKNPEITNNPNTELLDKLSIYLGHQSYHDFIISNSEEVAKPVKIDKPSNIHITDRGVRKTIFISLVLIMITAIGVFISFDKTRWMVWQEDHYEEVPFDTEKYELRQLKLYKEERLKHLKKIDVNCDFGFFKKDGTVKVWYGKNQQKELEYFTNLGEHPETGKTLKPISQYMIDKHICDSMN